MGNCGVRDREHVAIPQSEQKLVNALLAREQGEKCCKLPFFVMHKVACDVLVKRDALVEAHVVDFNFLSLVGWPKHLKIANANSNAVEIVSGDPI